MTDHPLARLLLYRIVPSESTPSLPILELTASQTFNRYTRTAEFLTGIVVDRAAGIIVSSLYVGLLSVIEIGPSEKAEAEKSKRRRSSVAAKGKKRERKESGDFTMEVEEEEDDGNELGFKEYYEIK